MKTINPSVNGTHNRPQSPNEAKPAKSDRSPSDAEPLKPSGDGSDGRAANGRFVTGNRGGTGNPFARRVAALRSALFAELNEDKLTKLASKLLDQAMNGDVAAAKLVLLYSIGKPAETVDPDRLDLDEWKLLDENPTRSETMRAALDGVMAVVAAKIVLNELDKKRPEDLVELSVPEGAGKQMVESILRQYFDLQQRRVEKR